MLSAESHLNLHGKIQIRERMRGYHDSQCGIRSMATDRRMHICAILLAGTCNETRSVLVLAGTLSNAGSTVEFCLTVVNDQVSSQSTSRAFLMVPLSQCVMAIKDIHDAED